MDRHNPAAEALEAENERVAKRPVVPPMKDVTPILRELVKIPRDSDGRPLPEREFEFSWHSTPALWSATRPGYDGAPDSGCKMGFGKTKEAAAADLVEQEEA